MKSKRTKATEIPKKVKLVVWERDLHCCIFCGRPVTWYYACAHIIPRSAGGLGIEQNIVTACFDCHRQMDQTIKRNKMISYAKQYLEQQYGKIDWNKNKYKKV